MSRDTQTVACDGHQHILNRNPVGVFSLPVCFFNRMFTAEGQAPYVPAKHAGDMCIGTAFYFRKDPNMTTFPEARHIDGQAIKQGEVLVCDSCGENLTLKDLDISEGV